ncbi:MAG TPA: EAL domain-containing protein [Mycoplana sp.]|nr:EAL domain-containing protein [Mycoplana sp.]
MIERSIFSNFTSDTNGKISALHGPYLLQSAFQPILRETSEGVYELEAIEGLVRASRDGVHIPATELFSVIDEEDRPLVDSLCRSLHILNAGLLGRNDVTLLIKSQPGLFHSPYAIRLEIDRMRLAAHQAGLAPARIACEIRERPGDDLDGLVHFASQLHEAGFLVAIDEYSATDHNLVRLSRLQPDFLKFDPIWMQRFAGNSAGVALMRVMIAQLERGGTRPIVPGVEASAQVELCRELGMPLMQGYLLGWPQFVPTSPNRDFPTTAGDTARVATPVSRLAAPANRPPRTAPRFGRRIA